MIQQARQAKQKNSVKADGKAPWGRWRLFSLVALVAMMTFFSFSPVMKNGFVNQDDDIYVFNNTSIDKSIPEAVVYFFEPHYFSGNYVPVTMISYCVINHIGGKGPEIYHTVNLLIHLANVLLVFCFIYLLSGRKPLVAATVALFFGVHPMHVESVAWVAELKDVLYALFFISGLIAYLYYLERQKNAGGEHETPAPGRRALRFLLLSFLLFSLSVLSKPAAVVFPLVLLLIDFYTYRKFSSRVWFEKIPFILVSVIFGMIAIRAQQADQLINTYYPLGERLIFACYAFCSYLVKFILPINLSAFYPYPNVASQHLPYLFYVAPLAVFLFFYAVYKTLKYSRLVAFGSLFFFVNVVLVLQALAIGNAITADRYTYIPYIGLLFMVAMSIDLLNETTTSGAIRYKRYVLPLLFIAAIANCCTSYVRCSVWENADTIADDILDKFPDDGIALNNKGNQLLMQGKYPESAHLFEKAIEAKPEYVRAYINLVNADLAMNDYNNAQKVADTLLRRAPNDYDALNKKGYLLFMQNKYSEALTFYKAALLHKKDYIVTYLNIGQIYYNTHQYNEWIKTMDAALAYEPENIVLLNNKGYALFLKGDYTGALKSYRSALAIKPDYEVALANLANCERAMSAPAEGK